jgi:hypothetical protein
VEFSHLGSNSRESSQSPTVTVVPAIAGRTRPRQHPKFLPSSSRGAAGRGRPPQAAARRAGLEFVEKSSQSAMVREPLGVWQQC